MPPPPPAVDGALPRRALCHHRSAVQQRCSYVLRSVSLSARDRLTKQLEYARGRSYWRRCKARPAKAGNKLVGHGHWSEPRRRRGSPFCGRRSKGGFPVGWRGSVRERPDIGGHRRRQGFTCSRIAAVQYVHYNANRRPTDSLRFARSGERRHDDDARPAGGCTRLHELLSARGGRRGRGRSVTHVARSRIPVAAAHRRLHRRSRARLYGVALLRTNESGGCQVCIKFCRARSDARRYGDRANGLSLDTGFFLSPVGEY